jgi:Transposase, Mutator family
MTDNDTMDLLELMRNRLEGAEPDMLRDMVQFMAEGLMSAEADGLCGAGYGKRDPERVNQRNGAGTRALGRSSSRSRSSGMAATFRTGCSTTASVASAHWLRSSRRATCAACRPARSMTW